MAAVKKRGEVRDAAVAEARAIIAEKGLEALSLREVSRRLGVSHQAPYRHWPSRDHLLAEVIARSYEDFATRLDSHAGAESRHIGPAAAMEAMGRAYLDYARDAPLSYRLMFGAELPDPAAHPAMLDKARHAFGLLREAVSRLPEPGHGPEGRTDELDALFVWATVHGLASILQTRAVETLGLTDQTVDALVTHTLGRIGAALGQSPQGPPSGGAGSGSNGTPTDRG